MVMPLDQMTQPGPDGWDADSHPFPTGWPAPTRRMSAQRWLVDAVIRQVGVDWDQGRTRYIGNAGGTDAEIDFGQARERIAKLADIERVFATLGMRRERLAEAAVAAGHHVTARKHAYIASLLWGAAEWTFFVSPEQVRRAEVANQHKLRCYDLWMEHAPHPVRRIRVPYGRGSLSGILHLPPNASGPVPCVLHVGGMDSFKGTRCSCPGTDTSIAGSRGSWWTCRPGRGGARRRVHGAHQYGRGGAGVAGGPPPGPTSTGHGSA